MVQGPIAYRSNTLVVAAAAMPPEFVLNGCCTAGILALPGKEK